MTASEYQRFRSHDGVELAFRTAGQGRRVLLVHGLTVDSTLNWATNQNVDAAAGSTATVESCLVDAGCEVALFDLRGHGQSGKPHDSADYSMEIFADDVRSLAQHLGWDEAALVGYSFGAWIAERLLRDPWVSRAALCGIGASQVEGVDADEFESMKVLSACFTDGSWDDHPEQAPIRAFAESLGADFLAMGRVTAAMRPASRETLRATAIPVLVLNGGSDPDSEDANDLTPFIPGALRCVAGSADHFSACEDPAFQSELVKFLIAK